MKRIRLLLACRQLRDVHSWKEMLTHAADVELLGETRDPVDTLMKVGSNQAEIVLIDLPSSGKDPGLCSHLLSEHPHLKVVAVSSTGDRAVCFEAGMIRRRLEGESPEALMKLIRSCLITDGEEKP